MLRWRIIQAGSVQTPRWARDGGNGSVVHDAPMTEPQLTDLELRVAYLELVLQRIGEMSEREEPARFARFAMDYYFQSVKTSRD